MFAAHLGYCEPSLHVPATRAKVDFGVVAVGQFRIESDGRGCVVYATGPNKGTVSPLPRQRLLQHWCVCAVRACGQSSGWATEMLAVVWRRQVPRQSRWLQVVAGGCRCPCMKLAPVTPHRNATTLLLWMPTPSAASRAATDPPSASCTYSGYAPRRTPSGTRRAPGSASSTTWRTAESAGTERSSASTTWRRPSHAGEKRLSNAARSNKPHNRLCTTRASIGHANRPTPYVPRP